MPFKCSVPGCRSNCQGAAKASVFQFPRSEVLRQIWIRTMQKENFKIYNSSRVCEFHFEPCDVVRMASAIDSQTGRLLTARLRVPRLREGAVPTRLMPQPGVTYPPKRKKSRPEREPKEGAENADGNRGDASVKNDLETESEIVAETSIAITQEPVKSENEPPRPIIEKIHSAEEVISLSSSFIPTNSTPSSSNSLVYPTHWSFISNADPTSVDETPAAEFSNEPTPERKMIYSESDAEEPNSSETQSESPRPTTASKRRRKPHSKTRTSKKYAAHYDFRTAKSGDNATGKMFKSLMDGSEKNAAFGGKTRERPGDLFDVFAAFIADKLREMEWDDCAYSLRAILDIVFNASKVRHDTEAESDTFAQSNSSSTSSDQE